MRRLVAALAFGSIVLAAPALAQSGRVLFQSPVVVSAPQSGQVRVWRGARVTEMACGASCSPSIRSVDTGAAEVTP